MTFLSQQVCVYVCVRVGGEKRGRARDGDSCCRPWRGKRWRRQLDDTSFPVCSRPSSLPWAAIFQLGLVAVLPFSALDTSHADDQAWCSFPVPSSVFLPTCPLFLVPTARRCNLAGAHEVSDVLLKELVMVVELVVFFLDGFDAVEDGEQRVLQGFGMSA